MPLPRGNNKLQKAQWARFENSNLGTSIDNAVSESIKIVLENYFDAVIKQIKSNLNETSKTQNQSLAKSIRLEYDDLGDTIEVQITMNDYWKYVDQGVKGRYSIYPETSRSPFQYPMQPKSSNGAFLESIKLWIVNKPIQIKKGTIDSVAFSIRNSIINKGTRATKFFSSVINQESVNDLIAELEAITGKRIKIGIAEFNKQIRK
jgi:hypothetical protein